MVVLQSIKEPSVAGLVCTFGLNVQDWALLSTVLGVDNTGFKAKIVSVLLEEWSIYIILS
jgi:hypothetical protein